MIWSSAIKSGTRPTNKIGAVKICGGQASHKGMHSKVQAIRVV